MFLCLTGLILSAKESFSKGKTNFCRDCITTGYWSVSQETVCRWSDDYTPTSNPKGTQNRSVVLFCYLKTKNSSFQKQCIASLDTFMTLFFCKLSFIFSLVAWSGREGFCSKRSVEILAEAATRPWKSQTACGAHSQEREAQTRTSRNELSWIIT